LILQSLYPRLKHKISHIANCVDVDVFTPRQSTSAKGINALGVGRLVEYKNVKVLIEAVAILRHQHNIPIRVTWVGRPYEEEGVQNQYYHECIALIQQRNISDAWIWAGKQRNVAEQYQANDLLLHPSYGEGFPNVICEALACGTPVIASNVIDHPYIIEEGRNGFLFEPSSVDELVDKVMLFSKLPLEKRTEMSINCRKSAVEKFSPHTMISQYYTLFKSI
jgi:GalNAc-alpha-(1->4)-GalNAc-alpha-(1->3)-diNAcBac-PP-undecaprenol alpha-1,4-N-acetyl-D-galactosaminyltransferase